MIKICPVVFSILFLSLVTAFAADPEDLYTQEGTDPSADELIANGTIVPGESWSTSTVPGSKIYVNHDLLEQQTGVLAPNSRLSGVHIPTSGRRTDYGNISRWYQESGNTHIFRLFKGEHNYRYGNVGDDPEEWFAIAPPSRVEGVSPTFTIAPGTWIEWEGTYTIIKPTGAAIFQWFHHGGQHWAFHLNMSSTGDISFNRRRDIEGLPRSITLATNMIGKSIGIKVRGNGYEYELYRKIHNEDDDWVLVTKGYYVKAINDQISIRCGIYPGSKPGPTPRDAMLFVSGVNWKVWTPQLPQLLVTADAHAGTVTRNPDQAYYEEGEEVVVKAEAKPGFRFENWTGDYEGEENPLTLKMDSTIRITANFVAEFTVTISEKVVNGTVAVSPDKPLYDYGETISCIPHPAPGYRFDGWYAEGGIGGSAVPLQITINRDIELTAYFNLITHQLIASATNGTITRNPYRSAYTSGTQVELTATPNEGYQFTGWSGYVSSGENPITMVMDSTIYITANFDRASSIEQTSDVLFKVYPNPSKGDLTLEIGQRATYFVYNLSGIRLKEGEGYGTFHLDLKGYPRGMYLLEIRTQEGVGYKRLLLN